MSRPSPKNKRYIIAVVAIAGCLLLGVFVRSVVLSYYFDECYERTQEPVVGVLYRNKPANLVNPGQIRHYTLVWKNSSIWSADKPVRQALQTSDVLITVEPWIKSGWDSKNVLTETISGKFDSKIETLGSLIKGSRHTAYVRWCPDMEVPVFIYPWQYQSPQQYNQAFRYFAAKLRAYAPNVVVVWGPSGFPGDTEYWPGNAAADMASVTLGSVSEYSTNAYPFASSVPQMLKEKLHRLRFINKPVLLIGSTHVTPGNFNRQWVADELNYINQNKAVVYSPQNFSDTGARKPERQSLVIGVHDPHLKLVNQKRIAIEHMFVDAGEVQRGEFADAFNQIIARNHDAIVTMEPGKDTLKSKPDPNVVQSILNHRYDDVFRKLFKTLATTKHTVYLRFMHEMEIPIHRYAWQSKDPVEYIKAFRYFMQFEGGPPPNVKKVWGPAGDRGSIDFWPGSDVVDFVSVAVYGLPDKNITDPNKQEAFSTIFNRKFYRMRFADRPVFVTEMGVKGPEDYQDKWLDDAAKIINANPHVFGVCYFNLSDVPQAWGKIKPPDWSITPHSMQLFMQKVK